MLSYCNIVYENEYFRMMDKEGLNEATNANCYPNNKMERPNDEIKNREKAFLGLKRSNTSLWTEEAL